MDNNPDLMELKTTYPNKFLSVEEIFGHIHRGNRIFVGTACGEPQYLVKLLVEYANSHPKAFFDVEVFHVWTLGVAPYTDRKFKRNFRHNSFFIGNSTRDTVNKGLADYTPVFISQVPDLFAKKRVPLDVALIQTSLPDANGYMSLGVSVDITKAAVDDASIIIVQVNPQMPRVYGDTFIHMNQVDFAILHDEPLLEYENRIMDDTAKRIGRYIARLVNDGDTIQVGYGSVPNAIVASLSKKKDIGIHTELLTDGIVDLMRNGVVTNKNKAIDRGKTVAAFCMGKRETYQYINDNPKIEFRGVEYTNNPLVIAGIKNLVAINGALQIDLTGQSTAESIGKQFYSGIGGQADFMRGATLAPGGKSILVFPSTAKNGQYSRIVPLLAEGTGVTLTRGDVHYVVTEFGIAYIHGKNIRERAMDLISIANPKFRPQLIEKAKKLKLIYEDQAYVLGNQEDSAESLESYRTTSKGLMLKFRPVRINDESLIKDMFYALSDKSMYRRFMSARKDMPHELRQNFIATDYSKEMLILAIVEKEDMEELVALGQYAKCGSDRMAEVAIVVCDNYQNKGIGTELMSYLALVARKQGLLGFTAEVLGQNLPMLHVFEKMDFDINSSLSEGTYELSMIFRKAN
jgi:acyl-CoA hydrolase/GNAT superfamily N-acetyltransferase